MSFVLDMMGGDRGDVENEIKLTKSIKIEIKPDCIQNIPGMLLRVSMPCRVPKVMPGTNIVEFA